MEETMASYTINIKLTEDTPKKLIDGGYWLYGFKAVQGPRTGVPLVWFRTQNFLENLHVKWVETYQAYISNSEELQPEKRKDLPPDVQVTADTSWPVELGDIITILNSGGEEKRQQGGQAGAVTIRNESNTPFTTGISQKKEGGEMKPICAFPLYGHGSDVIVPIEKVLLMFATESHDTGTVIAQAFSEGMVFNMTNVPEFEVAFDINNGWNCAGSTICENVGFKENLLPILIVQPE
jgi:hypothetical protein